jgi:steroid delta-isomerase-like uncharacterized protein
MSAQGKSEKVVRRFYDELWNAWKLELIDELVAEDVRFRGSLGTTVSGREAFRKYVEGVRQAFPDWHNAIDELLVIGDRVVTRMTWTGTHRGELSGMTPTGAVVRYVGAAFFRMDEGVIVEVWVVGDTQELWKSIGRL